MQDRIVNTGGIAGKQLGRRRARQQAEEGIVDPAAQWIRRARPVATQREGRAAILPSGEGWEDRGSGKRSRPRPRRGRSAPGDGARRKTNNGRGQKSTRGSF
jgi:hypothetical protein